MRNTFDLNWILIRCGSGVAVVRKGEKERKKKTRRRYSDGINDIQTDIHNLRDGYIAVRNLYREGIKERGIDGAIFF